MGSILDDNDTGRRTQGSASAEQPPAKAAPPASSLTDFDPDAP